MIWFKYMRLVSIFSYPRKPDWFALKHTFSALNNLKIGLEPNLKRLKGFFFFKLDAKEMIGYLP